MNGQAPKISNLPFSPTWIPVLLILVFLPVVANLGLFSTFYITLTTKIFIFCILLLGFDLLAGYTGMVSFGHAMFFGLGAYTAALSLLYIAPDIWLAIGIAVASCLLVGVVVGFLSIRTHGVYFIFITLAFAQFFYLAAFHWIAVTGGDNGLPGIPSSNLLGNLIPIDLGDRTNFYYFAFVFVILSYIVCRRIVNSPFGRTLVGIRENQERMQFLGYNVARYKWAAFIISGGFGGLAGALFAHQQNYVSAELLHWLTSAEVIIMTWLGGVGTLIGPMLGGAIVIFFEDFFSSWMADNWLMIMGFVYVMFVLFSPRGLMGIIEKIRSASKNRAAQKQRAKVKEADL